jgi:hypothetical protein
MSQSPELAGGEGFTFEGDAAAFYLSALLAEAYAPGIEDRTVVKVSVQQRDFGEPLDDVIVDFEDVSNAPARLSLQVKRSLTISDAKTNKDFRDIIRDSWDTLKKSDFRLNADRYGAAVGTITPKKERALKTLCDWARESLTDEDFDVRFTKGGIASADINAVKNTVVALIEEIKKTKCTSEEVHQFLAHFVLIQFDFLREGATDPSIAINHIRDSLASNDATKAPIVWSKVVQLARASAGKAGQFDRTRLVYLLSPIARLRGSTSLRQDLDKLTEISKNYANLIPDDIGGTKLERTSLLEQLDTKLNTARVVQVRGLPGSGKSVVIRRAVQRGLESGPIIFIKAEQLEGTSWINYASSQGLSGILLEQLLVEIGVTGTPILFIDAIDRIEKEHQPVILDLINTIKQSPLLDNWRVAVSLRDTGIEVLRNWLGDILYDIKVETLAVNQLSDAEAETLAVAKPHLRSLLFGSTQVKEIVRRPFFAKVLNQAYVADPSAPTFTPQSEVDLIENWWRRGGYNATGQSAIERQRTLIDLAGVRARQLSQPIGLKQLTSVTHIDDLRTDGILQNAREGISTRFSHDIFFEWAFFYVLTECGTQWMEEINACGEPPSIARVVELVSQWEYEHGEDWSMYLGQAEDSELRSQWLRAWLLGSLGTEKFEGNEEQFEMAIFTDDFRLFRKVLVWFQAEKTSPNASILAGELPFEQRQRFADYLGWPSDVSTWRRLINFILKRISNVPQRLYPEVVAIFEVWQNALSDLCNPTSHALLQQCASWLEGITTSNYSNKPDENTAYWAEVPNLGDFQRSLAQQLLRSSRVEPKLAADYIQQVINLQRATNLKHIHEKIFHDIISFSPILAQSLPELVVELSLEFLIKELPDEQVFREKQERIEQAKRRKVINDKPEAERSHKEKMMLSYGFPLGISGGFSRHDWERLSIQDDHQSFWPPSPLREPFHSLFKSSPNDALRLLRELCNHAMTAWCQLHPHSRDRHGTPIPIELIFPWGTQKFWGTDREYLWFRSTCAPKIIGCGYMALEEWCFAEVERGKPIDELLNNIIEGNECIATLGIAAMLALHTETVSEATLPLFTSQRLLTADRNRMGQDLSSSMNLIGFTNNSDKPHIEAIQAANAQPVRKTHMCQMVPGFIFATGQISDRAREALFNFPNELPYQYEEHRNIPSAQEHLRTQALEYAELADPKNYQAYNVKEDSEQMAIVHVSPSAAMPENIAKVDKASLQLKQMGLSTWATTSFEKNKLNNAYTLKNAIVLAKEADIGNLFIHSKDENEEEMVGMYRGSVAATAAMILTFREGLPQKELDWARDVLERAVHLPEKPGLMWSSGSIIPWHHGIYVARGLAAELLEGTEEDGAVENLLGLIAHPLEVVSLAAFEETCKLWTKDPKLTWSAMLLAFSLCHISPRPHEQARKNNEVIRLSDETQVAVDKAFVFYDSDTQWESLPLLPPAWVKVESQSNRRVHQSYEGYDEDDTIDPEEIWSDSDVFWHSKLAAEILNRIPLDDILKSSAKNDLLDFLTSALNWTNQKNSPPWVKPGRRDRSSAQIFEWTNSLGSKLGEVAGLLPLNYFQTRFLDPIIELEGDSCWDLLSPFADTYIKAYVFDAPAVPADAVKTLDLCLGRFLQISAFKRNTYRCGEFYGFEQPKLVRSLMFVSVERDDLATRYVNGNWSEISRIMPLIDRFICAGGWAASVMEPFLTLCERAKLHYPAEAFANQMVSIIGEASDDLKGWHGTFLPARIAELVQYLSHRDAPIKLALAQKFLRILDILVDMGDRRSSALQLGEIFREVRLPP